MGNGSSSMHAKHRLSHRPKQRPKDPQHRRNPKRSSRKKQHSVNELPTVKYRSSRRHQNEPLHLPPSALPYWRSPPSLLPQIHNNYPMSSHLPYSQAAPMGMLPQQVGPLLLQEELPYMMPPQHILPPAGEPILQPSFSMGGLSVPPMINNLGMPPISPNIVNPVGTYRGAAGNLFTDWTGGGKISPGFLGPPI